MQGPKWNSVCNSVEKFASNLTEVDFIAGMVFNDKVQLLLNQRLIDEVRRNQNQKAIGYSNLTT